MPHATEVDAGNFYGDGASELELSILMGAAARTVEQLAPPDSDPPSTGYVEAAAQAELLVGRWIRRSDYGVLSAKGGIPSATGSKTFSKLKDVQDLVRAAMGNYYVGDTAVGGAAVGIISPSPF